MDTAGGNEPGRLQLNKEPAHLDTDNRLSSRNADGTYGIATYYPGGWFSADGLDSLQPGKAYWFKAPLTAALQYNP
jgi:hypothetical protein